MSRNASTVSTVFLTRALWVVNIRISLPLLSEYRDACRQSADDYYITRPRVTKKHVWPRVTVLRDVLELVERNYAYATYISPSTSLRCEETNK